MNIGVLPIIAFSAIGMLIVFAFWLKQKEADKK